MDHRFPGFGPEVFAWFAGLERDNSKAYFTATRDVYDEQVRGALEAMMDELNESVGGDVHVFRQHRDLRFSADKSPYNTRTSALVDRPGSTALYVQLGAEGLYAGTGYYRLASDQLARFRDAVADEGTGARLAALVDDATAAGLELGGETLRSAPRGYPRDHPRIELLRHKSLGVGRRLPADGGISRAAALEHVTGTWRATEPIVAWLDEHVGSSTLPPEAGRRPR